MSKRLRIKSAQTAGVLMDKAIDDLENALGSIREKYARIVNKDGFDDADVKLLNDAIRGLLETRDWLRCMSQPD